MEEGVEIVINHRQTTGITMCAYYNFSMLVTAYCNKTICNNSPYILCRMGEYEPFWSTDGCTVQKSSPEQTVCYCTHLTHFAVLSDSIQSITQVTAHVQFIVQ